MLRSRKATYCSELSTTTMTWRKSSGIRTLSTQTCGMALRTYQQDECRIDSTSMKPSREVPLPEAEKALVKVMVDAPKIVTLSWSRTEALIEHAWDGSEPIIHRRTHDQLAVGLHDAQRVWVEPIFTRELDVKRWKIIEEELEEIRTILALPLSRLGSGTLPVIFTHGTAAVMAHELIGHPVEAQVWAEKLSPYSRSLHAAIAAECLSMDDDPTRPHLIGYMNCDDEGFETRCLPIIREGKLVNILGDYLHSKLLPCKPGSGRCADYSHFPTARMSNTVILPGPESVDAAHVTSRKRLDVVRLQGGRFSPDGTITLTVRLGILWEGRQPIGRVENAVLSGHLGDLLKKITAVGDTTRPCWSFGLCGRSGQALPVGAEAPDLFIEEMEVL